MSKKHGKKQSEVTPDAPVAEVFPAELPATDATALDYSTMDLDELIEHKPGLLEWLQQTDFAHMLLEEKQEG